MIETDNLTKAFDGDPVVNRLTFSVPPGQILGFLGPNGAGKSTTVKMLTGMLEPTFGTARVAGYDIIQQPIEVKKRIGYVPEGGAIYEHLSGIEYLELVAALHHLEPEPAQKRSEELLHLLGLDDAKQQRISEYSKGMRQKVLFAAALLPRPDVLFLDEPLNGLDANAAGLIKDLLQQLAAQGKTIFFSSHILEVVERICTRIIIIQDGALLVEGAAEQIAQDQETKTLEAAFRKLTGLGDAGQTTADLLAALEEA